MYTENMLSRYKGIKLVKGFTIKIFMAPFQGSSSTASRLQSYYEETVYL